jgi:hypothetical protein
MPVQSSAVLFVDMLGFASLVEGSPEMLPTLGLQSSTSRVTPSPALDTFMRFHQTIDKKVQIYVKHGITAIIFSDSAYIHFPNHYHVVTFASELMRAFLYKRVPVRMGIGAGSFLALWFNN